MTTPVSKKRIEKWPLDKLTPHPRQNHLFKVPTADHIDQLAQSMSQPSTNMVEICSDGTIICGHSRVMAARQLGWTEIEVWVREDLEAQGSNAVLRRLIEDNTVRRQLTLLDQARCIKELFELEKNDKNGVKGKGNLRDLVAAQCNMSGRNLERYMNVLKAPMEVQTAFDENKLTLDEASRVGGMKPGDQKKVVEAIVKWENARDAVQRYLKKSCIWKQKPGNDSSKYLRSLRSWQVKTKVRIPDITSVGADDVKVLQAAKNVIEELLQMADQKKVEPKKGRSKTGTVKCKKQPSIAAATENPDDFIGRDYFDADRYKMIEAL